jgi:uncharacterized membrane protein
VRSFPIRDPRAWPWLVLAAIGIVVGLWLRLSQLRTQVLVDDEWHAVRRLVETGYAGIATHFGGADYCIPLTLYYRWLYDLGALSEWQMRLPLVIAGLALIALAPWLLRRSVALPVRAVWIALLSVSPVLVYLSRTARPYALACVLAFVAIVAFMRWREQRSRAWGFAYVVATVLAAWLHLLTIVFTLWPFAWFGVPLLRDALRASTRTTALRDLARIVGLAIASVVGLAIVLVPPLRSDWHAMAAKAGEGSVTPESLYRSLLMMFGISSAWILVVIAALVALGIRERWRVDRAFTACIAGMIVVGPLAIALARPAWIEHPQTFVRYVLPILPFLLLFLAAGLVAVAVRLRVSAFGAGASALAIAGLVAAGPLPRWYSPAPNQLMGPARYQFDFDESHNPYATKLVLGPVPAFYRDLASRPPGSVTLIETPALLISHYLPDPWYQAIHRQNLKYAIAAPVCGNGEADEIPPDAHVKFRALGKLVDVLDGATWGADYLVLRLHAWSVPPGLAQAWPDMGACEAAVTAELGAPVYRDDEIAVFQLAKKS